MEKPDLRFAFPELSQSIADGFTHDFKLHSNGLIYCLSHPDKFYELDELSIRIVPCNLRNTTLLLIKTNDGLLGNMVEYHEI